MRTEMMCLLRHGNRIDSKDRHWRSTAERPYDPPLDCMGHMQAIAAADRIIRAGVNVESLCVLSSPFLRCLQTASLMCDRLGTVFDIEHALCERLHSRFIYGDTIEWMPRDEIKRHMPHLDEFHTSVFMPSPPNESRHAVRGRTQLAVQRIVEDYAGPWLLIGHGFTVKDASVMFGGSGKIPKMGELRLHTVEIDDG